MFNRIANIAFDAYNNEEVFEFVDRVLAHGGHVDECFLDQYREDARRCRYFTVHVSSDGWVVDGSFTILNGESLYRGIEEVRLHLPYMHELPEDVAEMAKDVRLWPFAHEPFVNNVLMPARRAIEFSKEVNHDSNNNHNG